MIRKNENFGTCVIMTGAGTGKVGACEYQMPQAMATELLKERKGQEKNMRPQDYLVKYVNEQCGLLYNCVRVTTI
jgi:hypothetical protein